MLSVAEQRMRDYPAAPMSSAPSSSGYARLPLASERPSLSGMYSTSGNVNSDFDTAARFLNAFKIDVTSPSLVANCREFIRVQLLWREKTCADYSLLSEACIACPDGAVNVFQTRLGPFIGRSRAIAIYRAHEDNAEFGPKLKAAITRCFPTLNLDVVNIEEVTCPHTKRVFNTPIKVRLEKRLDSETVVYGYRYLEKADALRAMLSNHDSMPDPLNPDVMLQKSCIEEAPEMVQKIAKYKEAAAAAVAPAQQGETRIDEYAISCCFTCDILVDPVLVIENERDAVREHEFYFERKNLMEYFQLKGRFAGNDPLTGNPIYSAPNPLNRNPIRSDQIKDGEKDLEKIREMKAKFFRQNPERAKEFYKQNPTQAPTPSPAPPGPRA
jgi:hypothetical protein